MASIFFTVTNDLTYDQRMIRICNTLSAVGYDVTLVGRKKKDSVNLNNERFRQTRLDCLFEKGKLFYLEYNIRLFLFLVTKKMDAICAIDLDSIIPCYYISRIKNCTHVYDAHEYFSQQKEIVSRPAIYKIWHWVEKNYIPKFIHGYTVSEQIAGAFKMHYGVDYAVIRNLPMEKTRLPLPFSVSDKKILIYQGAVNEARGLEYLVPAMKQVDAELHIYGDGNFMGQVKILIRVNNLEQKVFMKGKLLPAQLEAVTQQAYLGLNLVENTGLNQYYSLANKFFDFIQAGIPQVTMDFPEYRKVNEAFEVACLLGKLDEGTIARAINGLLQDKNRYAQLQKNCLEARKVYNWEHEEKKLISFYRNTVG